ncbi:MAG: lysylphosphatidylglycerol synthase domain-containing protein [Flavobacteriales bacterium]|nr:lysylphosphatidylglycerol synthase domain-containing protein [Flavobacteriales bacterium]
MYKRVSTALNNSAALITLRLATIVLLGSLAWLKYADVQSTALQIDLGFLLPILIVGILTLVNLATEALKYQTLFGKKEMDFDRSFKSILAGMSVGIWTPNRAGEFIGRLEYVSKEKRNDSIVATLAGSAIQGVVTLFMGAIGFAFFKFPIQINLPIYSTVFIGLLIIAASYAIFRTGPLRRFREKHVNVAPNRVFVASVFAFLRYLIFTSQFVILLNSFGFQGDFFQAYFGVFVLYVVQTYMPGSLLSELGVREVLSIFLFAAFFENEMGAVMAAFCLWLLNIGFPIASWSLYGALKRVELN